jgi:hypothetical protein
MLQGSLLVRLDVLGVSERRPSALCDFHAWTGSAGAGGTGALGSVAAARGVQGSPAGRELAAVTGRATGRPVYRRAAHRTAAPQPLVRDLQQAALHLEDMTNVVGHVLRRHVRPQGWARAGQALLVSALPYFDQVVRHPASLPRLIRSVEAGVTGMSRSRFPLPRGVSGYASLRAVASRLPLRRVGTSCLGAADRRGRPFGIRIEA